MNVSTIILSALLVAGCGTQLLQKDQRISSTNSFEHGKLGRNAGVSAAKLREYCKACHAVGNMRFIWNESDEDLWHYIFTNKAPNRNKLWAESIFEVLNWPTDNPPAPDPVMDPPNGRDWMPRGSKRLHFANDKSDGVPVRQVILKAIRDNLE